MKHTLTVDPLKIIQNFLCLFIRFFSLFLSFTKLMMFLPEFSWYYSWFDILFLLNMYLDDMHHFGKNSLSLSLPLLSPLTILDFIYRHATSLQYFIWAMCFFFAIFIISSLFASVWIFSFYFSFSSAVLSRSVSNIGKSIDFWVELYFYLYDFPLFLFTIFYFSAEISSTLINSMNTLTIMY